jgi:tetratricopeptide (TPR) repeat protein
MSAVDDLRRQLEAASAALEELDEDLRAGRISAADHADLKARSERQAAALLERVEEAERQGGEAPAARQGRVAPVPVGARLRSRLGLTLGGLALVLVGVGLGILLGRSTADAPKATGPQALAPQGMGPAGMPPRGMGAPGGPAPPSTELAALRQLVEAKNAPTEKLLFFAHRALDEQQIPAAIWAYKRVLGRDSKNVEAITHIGVILTLADHWDQALARFDEAIGLDPTYAHAHWDRASALMNGKQDYPGAAAALEAFLKLVPEGEDAKRARDMLTEARRLHAEAKAISAPAASAPAPGTGSRRP